jgi:hypothetical protein
VYIKLFLIFRRPFVHRAVFVFLTQIVCVYPSFISSHHLLVHNLPTPKSYSNQSRRSTLLLLDNIQLVYIAFPLISSETDTRVRHAGGTDNPSVAGLALLVAVLAAPVLAVLALALVALEAAELATSGSASMALGSIEKLFGDLYRAQVRLVPTTHRQCAYALNPELRALGHQWLVLVGLLLDGHGQLDQVEARVDEVRLCVLYRMLSGQSTWT